MCGIAGVWNRSGQPVDKRQIEDMTRVLAHRGPDGQGVQLLGDIALGHRRLSIIDLSAAAHQPMSLPDQSLWITYNGEIHNYIELRSELKSRGVSFLSESDTEVALWAYKIWGAECFERFNGMWAMALWEPRERRLTLSRDRFGIKPLHYSVSDGRVAFGSEAKAILAAFPSEARADWKIAYEFMAGGWPQADENTFFANIKSVPPAHNLIFDQTRMSRRKYWRFEPGQVMTHTAEKGDLISLLDDAVRLRLRSDVPVAACLSGDLLAAVADGRNRGARAALDHNDALARKERHRAQFIQDEALPGCADLGVGSQLFECLDAEKCVKQAGIRQVDLRGLHLSLGDVLVPGRQSSDHERGHESVQVPSYCRVRDAERTSELGGVQDLTVVMSEHGPESAKGLRGRADSKLGQVALEEGPEETQAPEHAGPVRRSQERAREPAPQPEFLGRIDAHLRDREAGELVIRDSSREGLRALPQEIR